MAHLRHRLVVILLLVSAVVFTSGKPSELVMGGEAKATW